MATDVSDLIAELERFAVTVRDEAAAQMLEDARADAPVSPITPTNLVSGTLRDSLRLIETADNPPVYSAAIGSDLDYAQFTDEVDTAPHEIRRRYAPMLRFWWENAPIELGGPDIYYFLRVNHPGTKGQHWFESKNEQRWNDALEAAERTFT